MARPENRSEARALSLTLPIETFNYLALLAINLLTARTIRLTSRSAIRLFVIEEVLMTNTIFS